MDRRFGHTGATGAFRWIAPAEDLFQVLLTNRLHPIPANAKHVPLRRTVADVVQTAIPDAPLPDREVRR